MQTIQLQNFGVSELSNNEFEAVNGGEWPSLKSISWTAVAVALAENWGEVKSGFLEGWNAIDFK